MLFQVLNFQQEFWGALTDFFTLLCDDSSPIQRSISYVQSWRIVDCSSCLSINRVIDFPKCRISRNGISRYSLSRVCPLVSDKISIVPSFSSFSPSVIPCNIFIAGHALECYVCTDQEGNQDKCLNTIKTCEQGQDSCLTDIRWGSKFNFLHFTRTFFLRLCELSLKHVLFICIF